MYHMYVEIYPSIEYYLHAIRPFTESSLGELTLNLQLLIRTRMKFVTEHQKIHQEEGNSDY